jgi:hypothetical protein
MKITPMTHCTKKNESIIIKIMPSTNPDKINLKAQSKPDKPLSAIFKASVMPKENVGTNKT